MNDFVTSLIRTYVPIGVGQVLSWLALQGVEVDTDTALAMSTALGGLLSAAYYLIVRLVERSYPQVGVLLGSTKKPSYADAPKVGM